MCPRSQHRAQHPCSAAVRCLPAAPRHSCPQPRGTRYPACRDTGHHGAVPQAAPQQHQGSLPARAAPGAGCSALGSATPHSHGCCRPAGRGTGQNQGSQSHGRDGRALGSAKHKASSLPPPKKRSLYRKRQHSQGHQQRGIPLRGASINASPRDQVAPFCYTQGCRRRPSSQRDRIPQRVGVDMLSGRAQPFLAQSVLKDSVNRGPASLQPQGGQAQPRQLRFADRHHKVLQPSLVLPWTWSQQVLGKCVAGTDPAGQLSADTRRARPRHPPRTPHAGPSTAVRATLVLQALT